jgi:hypothetical protein
MAATFYTFVQSARQSCMDVRPYLTDVLRHLPAIVPNDTAAVEALSPDRWVAVHPEHWLEQREEEPRDAQARRRPKRAAHPIGNVILTVRPLCLGAALARPPPEMPIDGVENPVPDGFPAL